MTVVPASRPAPLSRVWSGNRVLAEDLTGEDLSDVLEMHGDASAWWVLPRDDAYAPAELREVAKALDLDQLAVSDLLAEDRRAKFETVGQARLVITNVVEVDTEQVRVQAYPVSIIATDRALICLVAESARFSPGRILAEHEEMLSAGGAEVGLQVLLGAVIASYEEAVEFLEDATDALAELLFEERPLAKPEQLHAFRLRTALSQVRRLTEPMRTVTADLMQAPAPTRKGKGLSHSSINRRWTMLAERQARVASAADALREALSSVFDTSLALADTRLNQVMQRLTGWAAIIAVPTLVTSFVGMNVGFPLAGTGTGFWLYLGVMIVSAVALYAFFRRRDWV